MGACSVPLSAFVRCSGYRAPLLGVIYYQSPEIRDEMGGIAAFGLWMATVVVSMLAHEMGHAVAARLVALRRVSSFRGSAVSCSGLRG